MSFFSAKKKQVECNFKTIEGVVKRFGSINQGEYYGRVCFTFQIEGDPTFYSSFQSALAHEAEKTKTENRYEKLLALCFMNSCTTVGDRVRFTTLNDCVVVSFCNLSMWDEAERVESNQGSYKSTYLEVLRNAAYPNDKGAFSLNPSHYAEFLESNYEYKLL